MPKNHPKMYTKPPNSGYGYKHRGIDRDIGRKVVLSDVIPVQSRAHGSLVRTTDRQFFVTSGDIFEVQSFLRTTGSFCQIYWKFWEKCEAPSQLNVFSQTVEIASTRSSRRQILSRGSWKARCRIFWYAALWTQPDLVDRRSLITILKLVCKASSGYQMQCHTLERSVFMAVMVPLNGITVLVARTRPLSLLLKCWTVWKNMATKLLQQIQQQILARVISLIWSNRYGRYGHCTSKLKAIQATTKQWNSCNPDSVTRFILLCV